MIAVGLSSQLPTLNPTLKSQLPALGTPQQPDYEVRDTAKQRLGSSDDVIRGIIVANAIIIAV